MRFPAALCPSIARALDCAEDSIRECLARRRETLNGDLPVSPVMRTARLQVGTLGDVTGDRGWSRLDGRDNALNTIRLAFAAIVVLVHSWQFSQGHTWPPLPYASGFAVDGFFVLSGFLIAGSRTRLPLGTFLLRRALRILPGFWVVLVITAFGIAPLVAAVQGVPFEWSSAASYISRNAALAIHQPDISHLLSGRPTAAWNGSLWTLAWEGTAYVLAGALLSQTAWRRAGSWTMLVALTLVLAVRYGDALGGGDGSLGRPLTLLAFFAGGMVLRFESHRLPLRANLAVACALLVVGAFSFGGPVAYAVVGPLSVGYALLWIGARAPWRIGSRNDISYGVYIYGAPLQMAAVALGWVHVVGPAAFAALSLAAVIPVAWLSWLCVERPAMRLRLTRGLRQRSAAAAPELESVRQQV